MVIDDYRRDDIKVTGLVAILVPLMALPFLGTAFDKVEAVWTFGVAVAALGALQFLAPKIFPIFTITPFRAQRVLLSFPMILVALEFMDYFGHLKPFIWRVNPFSWDAAFIAIDRAIHFGDPWRWLQPILGKPEITSTISWSYNAWFLLISGGPLFFAIFVDDRKLRLRFLYSFFLIWAIIGIYFAVALSSVGPVFLERIMGDPYFSDQLDYIRSAHLQSPNMSYIVQGKLLAEYEGGDVGLGKGISAMPSMHVALAFLFWLAIRQVNKWAGWLFGAYCLVILVSSVHLGFHYAVDGYVAIALTYAVWMATAAYKAQRANYQNPLVEM